MGKKMMTDRDQQKSLLTGAAANPRDEVGNRKARAGTPGTRPPVKGAKHLGKHLRRCTAGMKGGSLKLLTLLLKKSKPSSKPTEILPKVFTMTSNSHKMRLLRFMVAAALIGDVALASCSSCYNNVWDELQRVGKHEKPETGKKNIMVLYRASKDHHVVEVKITSEFSNGSYGIHAFGPADDNGQYFDYQTA